MSGGTGWSLWNSWSLSNSGSGWNSGVFAEQPRSPTASHVTRHGTRHHGQLTSQYCFYMMCVTVDGPVDWCYTLEGPEGIRAAYLPTSGVAWVVALPEVTVEAAKSFKTPAIAPPLSLPLFPPGIDTRVKNNRNPKTLSTREPIDDFSSKPKSWGSTLPAS